MKMIKRFLRKRQERAELIAKNKERNKSDPVLNKLRAGIIYLKEIENGANPRIH